MARAYKFPTAETALSRGRAGVSVLLVLLSLLLPVSAARAELVSGLFEAQVSVPSSLPRGLNSSYVGDALLEVVVRASGNRLAADNERIAQALRRPSSWVREFSYSSLDAADMVPATENSPALTRMMKVVFSRPAVEKLLRDAGLSIWPNNRPLVVVWVVIDDYQSARWLNADNFPDITAQVGELFAKRGVPYVVPLFDLEDNYALPVSLGKMLNRNAVQLASQRYGADAILYGSVTATSTGTWVGSWWSLMAGEAQFQDLFADSAEAFFDAGIGGLADRMAEKYAIVPRQGSEEYIALWVGNIGAYDRYAEVNAYLNSLAAVRSADIVTTGDDSVLFRLQTDGEIEQLEGAFALDKRLQRSDTVMFGQNAELYYRWVDNSSNREGDNE